MRIRVVTRIPAFRNVPPTARRRLHLAGLQMGDLRAAWSKALRCVLEMTYPVDEWRVEVNEGHEGPPTFSVSDGPATLPIATLDATVEYAGAAWLASLVSLADAVTRERG